MEKYLGLNVIKSYVFKNTVANEERPMSGPFDQCWLLHQTDMDHGVSIRVNCSVGPLLKLTKVLPESLYLIRYEVGNYYYMESLLEEIEDHCIDLDKVLAKRGIYLDDFSDDEDAEIERYLEAVGAGRPWKTPPKAEFAQITANENGFCVFHPLEKRDNLLFKNWSRRNRRRIDVCYRPDSKKVQKGVLDYVSCKINIDTINTDVQAYFEKSLESEQMILSKEEGRELYTLLEENAEGFWIIGGELRIASLEKLFPEFKECLPDLVVHEGKEKWVKGYHAKDWFEWWMSDKIEKVVNRAIVLGLFEEKEPDRKPFDLDKLMNY